MQRFFIFVVSALICQTALGSPPKFHIEILQQTGGSGVTDINNFGKVIGRSPCTNWWACEWPPYFLYSGGNYQYLYGANRVFALNDQGYFLGRLAADDSQFIGNGTTWEYLPAAITQNARYAEDLNDNGVIVGRHNGQSAFYYENGIYTEIGLYKGIGSSLHRINNAKQIAGTVSNGSTASTRTEAFLYDAGIFHDIGQINNPNYSGSYTYTNVYALNDWGAVVGDSNYRAYIYQDGVISEVPGVADYYYSRATHINNQGTVLGHYDATTNSGDTYDFLFFEGVFYRLADLLTHPDDGTFQAFTLNDRGDIAGRYGNSQDQYSFIATFIPPAMVEVDVDPWSVSNSVKPESNDTIVVAVMGSSTANGDPINFDVSQIDTGTLKLGTGKAANFAVNPLFGDYDQDTINDAAFAFRTQDTGILCEDPNVTLEGETFSGDQFKGTSAIATTDCETGACHP